MDEYGKCEQCGSSWEYTNHTQGDMLVCHTCNVGWNCDDAIGEMKNTIAELEAENKELEREQKELVYDCRDHRIEKEALRDENKALLEAAQVALNKYCEEGEPEAMDALAKLLEDT